MDCEEFLADYSDFLDRNFEENALHCYCEHLLTCPSCADYDRVMRRGLNLVRQLDPPEPCADCSAPVQYRLRDRKPLSNPPVSQAGSLRAAGLAAAALVGLAALFVVLPGSGAVELPPVVVESPDAGAGSTALWGASPRFAPNPRLLEVPDPGADPFLSRPDGRLSLFRAPLRPAIEPREPAEVTPE